MTAGAFGIGERDVEQGEDGGPPVGPDRDGAGARQAEVSPTGPGWVPAGDDQLGRLQGEALFWEGAASQAREWLAYTRAALDEARAELSARRRDGDHSATLDLAGRIESLEEAERVQSAYAETVLPHAEASSRALSEALSRRDRGGRRTVP